MREQFIGFIVRWLFNTAGLWLAVKLFGTGYVQTPDGVGLFLLAGLVFSLINVLLKPIIVILSLPALLLTLGLFMFVVNGLLVYIAASITPGFSMTFWNSILTGAVISLLNYIVTNVIDLKFMQHKEETR